MDGEHIERLARWWTQATNEARFLLLQRVCGTKTPQKGDPTLAQLRLAIFVAEAAAGEVDGEAAGAFGQRLRRSESLHGEAPQDAQVNADELRKLPATRSVRAGARQHDAPAPGSLPTVSVAGSRLRSANPDLRSRGRR
jgi:hypothetical protein